MIAKERNGSEERFLECVSGFFGPSFSRIRRLRRILRDPGVFLARRCPRRFIAERKYQKRPIDMGIIKKESSALHAIDNGCRCNFWRRGMVKKNKDLDPVA